MVIKGWLFKLEGATIKQWKKRWCILSEYCLFYYKGPEEEKCLGSILLPSYKIRQCIAEDKVSLKHSFVAEHQNTKTYYFAAENSSCMCQWMNAMSLAALMQTETPHSAGATGHRQRHHPPPHGFPPSYELRPPLHQPPIRTSDESFEVEGYAVEHQYLGSGDQYPCSYTRSPIYDQRPGVAPGPRHPVYANAPPKPLRHGALSPTPGGYDGYNGYEAYDGYPGFEGYDGYDPQEQLPAYAGRPRSAHYGDGVAAVAMPALMRPHSADFLERDEEADVGEFRFGRVAASARPRPKSSMAQYDWEDEGYDEDEWRNCGGAVPAEKLVAGPQRGAAQDDPRRLLAGRRDDGGMQTKKTAHKEESMKRLLEWKQRMLQSPLRKKQGQQNLVPSSFELQSAVLKRPTQVLGGDVRAPPERPPLPEEYRRRVLDEVHAPGEVWTGQRRLSGGPSHEPIAGRPHEMQDAPGPDLIQHTKPQPPRCSDSPDYVNLRNIQCVRQQQLVQHSREPEPSPNPVPAKINQPLRSCLSPTNRVRQDASFAEPYYKQQSQMTAGTAPEIESGYVDTKVARSKTPTFGFIPASKHSGDAYNGSEGHSDRSLSPSNALVQRGNRRRPSSDRIVSEASPAHCNESETLPKELRRRSDDFAVTPPVSPGGSVEGQEHAPPEGPRSSVYGRPPSTLRNAATCLGVAERRDVETPLGKIRGPDRESVHPGRSAGLKSPPQDVVVQDRVYSNSSVWREESRVSTRPSHPVRETPKEPNTEGFYIKKEDYYRASQMFYPKQVASKSLLSSLSDSASSGVLEVETFDSRYRRSATVPTSPQWELDKDVGLPLPDNLDVSFQSTSNNSVFEGSCECLTPGDQSPELFQGTLRPSRTYVRDRRAQKDWSGDISAGAEAKYRDETTTKSGANFEELRSAFQKRKEAPPTNIVQDRIKRFECKDETGVAGKPQENWPVPDKKGGGDSEGPTCERGRNCKEGDGSGGLVLSKSEPAVHYGNSLLLTDLRRSADFKKEGAQTADDGATPPKVVKQEIVDAPPVRASLSPPAPVQHRSPEAHYLPMGGWLAKEADYVSMNVDLGSGLPPDEPVYNEPVLPMPSFVHDSFGKIRSLSRQSPKNESSGTSSEESTENIYEQVRQVTEEPPTLATSKEATQADEAPVYEEPYKLMCKQAGENVEEKAKSLEPFCKDGSKQAAKKPIPDLLHHEEVKDSGASDADDEASRADFDTPNSSLPSYQKEVLNEHLSTANRSSLLPRSSAQSYLPVYASHCAKYSFKRDKSPKPEQLPAGPPYGTSDKDRVETPQGHSPKPPPLASTSSKALLDGFVKASPFQSERPTSIGLLKSFDGDTSSSDAGSCLTGPSSSAARPSGPDASAAQGRTVSENFGQVSSPLLSTAPDILPSEVRNVVSESNSNKALNSAPYYYSDIFGDKLRIAERPSSRQAGQQARVAPNTPNNIREVGPTPQVSRDNVGRRVNKISTSVPAGLDASHVRTRSEPDPSAAEFESTLRGLLGPADARKFSDAERNKYVAGHTLEKTSHMSRSVLSHMRKQRPDSSPHPEPGGDRPPPDPQDDAEQQRLSSRGTGGMLPRRLSRSLEDVIDGTSSPARQRQKVRSKTPVIPTAAECHDDEPFYENVGFGSARRERASPPKSLGGASPQVSPAKHSVYDGEDLCRDFVVPRVLAGSSGPLGDSLKLLAASSDGMDQKESRNDVGSSQYDEVGKLSAELASLRLVGSDFRKEAGLGSDDSVRLREGKRCRSNDFAKPKTRDGMYRHSTDDLHSCNVGCHSLSPLQLDSEPTPPPSGGLSHSVSAGDLLGKSHEELVLLLIQLRRSQSSLLTCQMQCRAELQELKENIVQSNMKHSAADVQRLVSLQRSLNELTRNLGLTRPLISLVENMVKLGSLYNIAGIEKQNDRGVAEGTESKDEDVFVDNLESETLEKQQRMVEKEILRIQNMLAESTTFGSPLKEDLEVELKRLQKIVDNLLLRKGRTCPSPGLRLEEDRNTASTPEPRLSLACVPERKRHQKTYYETDLDSCVTSNLALSSRPSSLYNMSGSQMDGLESPSFSPEPSDRIEDDDNSCPTQDMNEADDRTKKFYGLLPRDRAQEIRTVRIVKRESERRHKGKDRRKGGASDDGALVWVVEQPETFFPHEQQTTESMSNLETSCPGGSYVSPYETKKEHGSTSQEDRSTSSSSSDSLTGCRRAPGKNDSRRNKRRHYTISGSHPFLDQHSPPKMPACLRSRDDMDMERCLRTVNTPDIVRSTIKKSDVYDEQTIDMQIGLPEKILIPERYIEEESENVSAVEQLRRSLKAANIRKMLTETVGYEDLDARGSLEAVRSQVGEEKRRRAHLLALSHTIAKEVMERSKMVAAHVSYQENT